jgi:hypothetical protein
MCDSCRYYEERDGEPPSPGYCDRIKRSSKGCEPCRRKHGACKVSGKPIRHVRRKGNKAPRNRSPIEPAPIPPAQSLKKILTKKVGRDDALNELDSDNRLVPGDSTKLNTSEESAREIAREIKQLEKSMDSHMFELKMFIASQIADLKGLKTSESNSFDRDA